MKTALYFVTFVLEYENSFIFRYICSRISKQIEMATNDDDLKEQMDEFLPVNKRSNIKTIKQTK